jgi:hypothetical protein
VVQLHADTRVSWSQQWLLELQQNTDAASLAAFAAPLHRPTSSEMSDTWPNDSLHDYQSLPCIGSLHRVPLHVTVAARTAAEHRCCQSGCFCFPIAPPHKLRNERHLANRLIACPPIIDAYWEPSLSPSSCHCGSSICSRTQMLPVWLLLLPHCTARPAQK